MFNIDKRVPFILVFPFHLEESDMNIRELLQKRKLYKPLLALTHHLHNTYTFALKLLALYWENPFALNNITVNFLDMFSDLKTIVPKSPSTTTFPIKGLCGSKYQTECWRTRLKYQQGLSHFYFCENIEKKCVIAAGRSLRGKTDYQNCVQFFKRKWNQQNRLELHCSNPGL